mmetsp:Transcript_9996/g.18223  ORF Transcript_9996/g.18223 Transcript_9996/m.18223 type:complete len:366 (+) Transcript_9996:435-1532(+)
MPVAFYHAVHPRVIILSHSIRRSPPSTSERPIRRHPSHAPRRRRRPLGPRLRRPRQRRSLRLRMVSLRLPAPSRSAPRHRLARAGRRAHRRGGRARASRVQRGRNQGADRTEFGGGELLSRGGCVGFVGRAGRVREGGRGRRSSIGDDVGRCGCRCRRRRGGWRRRCDAAAAIDGTSAHRDRGVRHRQLREPPLLHMPIPRNHRLVPPKNIPGILLLQAFAIRNPPRGSAPVAAGSVRLRRRGPAGIHRLRPGGVVGGREEQFAATLSGGPVRVSHGSTAAEAEGTESVCKEGAVRADLSRNERFAAVVRSGVDTGGQCTLEQNVEISDTFILYSCPMLTAHFPTPPLIAICLATGPDSRKQRSK